MQPTRKACSCFDRASRTSQHSIRCFRRAREPKGLAGRFHQCFGLDLCVGVPWKDRQRERELLRHCFSDVDHIAIQWLESRLGLLRSDFPLLRFGRTVNQREAVGYCALDRLESDDAALHELRLESSFQHDDIIALAAKLDSRGQTVEGEEVETPGKFLTFARRCFDPLAKWSGTQSCEWNNTARIRVWYRSL